MNFCTANLFFILSTLPEKAFSQHKTTQNVCSQIYENILKLRKKKLLFKDLFHINFFFYFVYTSWRSIYEHSTDKNVDTQNY